MLKTLDIPQKLLNWFDIHGRTLPWRPKPGQAKNPYPIWLAEIMLQQTTVATVKDYFEKFMMKWPTLKDLAQASQDEILHAWAGLGYYSRARNLHKCAQYVVNELGGKFPQDYDQLLKLPGIGPYTAAAISAIAFEKQATIVDGNVERVISRLYEITTPLPTSKPIIKDYASKLTPINRPGHYAEAIMDLGATICRPKKPLCALCPLQANCQSHAKGTYEELPFKIKAKKIPTRKAVMFWVESDGHIIIRKRPESGLLGSMWELPSTPWDTQSYKDYAKNPDHQAHRPIETDYTKLNGFITHTFTHFHLEIEIHKAILSEQHPDFHWVALKNLHLYAIPTVINKAIKFTRNSL